MARTYSQDITLGSIAPPFDLPAANPEVDSHGGRRSVSDYAGARVLVVVFTCNHCPYARHVEDPLIRIARGFSARGVQFVAISSNDPKAYPDDAFEAMAQRAKEKEYPFPYLFDETQAVARAYGAVCTPDLYVYLNEGGAFRLRYHGRVDETRPRQDTPSTGAELERVLEDLLSRGEVGIEQIPSMGCNIKWKPGNEPVFQPAAGG